MGRFGAVRTPVHLWIVGVLSLLWNGMGGLDYVMTQMRNESYLSNFTPEQMAYFTSFPSWMVAAWAVGVWSALLGSLLLLARSRLAVAAFGLSLIGMAASSLYQYGIADMPDGIMTAGAQAMNVAIWTVAIALMIYAYRMRKRGVLR